MYSLRAFARDLNIGSTSLSDVLSGKRLLSKKNLEKVCEHLSLSPLEIEFLQGELKGSYTPRSTLEVERLQIAEDSFRLIADWYYFAILNLAKIPKSPFDTDWVSQRLNISKEQTISALDRLCRMNLIENHKGVLKRTSNPIITTNDVPSRGLRKHHKDILEKASDALESVEVTQREISAMTMAINPAKLPEAKEVIRKAIIKLEKLLDDENPSEVYTVGFQLFPLTQPELKS